MKLGENARQGLVHVDFTPLSPRAGAAMSKVGGKGVTLSRKDQERGLSCTAARVLKLSIWGRTKHSKAVLSFLRPQTCAALLGMRGLSSELCAVAPQRGKEGFPGTLRKRGKAAAGKAQQPGK